MLIVHKVLLIIIITEKEFHTQITKCDGALKISIWCATSGTPCISIICRNVLTIKEISILKENCKQLSEPDFINLEILLFS